MATILDKIAAYKRDEVTAARQALPLAHLRHKAEAMPAPRDFLAALRRRQDGGTFALIAEIKRASPSKGLIRADFDPEALAQAYHQGGAACLSVLTDRPSFQGAPEFLMEARKACPLPLLRKDFMLDPYQVYEAKAWGADAILLIIAMIDDGLAAELEKLAIELGLGVLIEVHDENELERALNLSSPLIGINNRDLHSFVTSLETTSRLAPLVPADHMIISESGLFTHQDLQALARHGVNSFLIGESLMRQHDVAAATRAILGLQ